MSQRDRATVTTQAWSVPQCCPRVRTTTQTECHGADLMEARGVLRGWARSAFRGCGQCALRGCGRCAFRGCAVQGCVVRTIACLAAAKIQTRSVFWPIVYIRTFRPSLCSPPFSPHATSCFPTVPLGATLSLSFPHSPIVSPATHGPIVSPASHSPIVLIVI